MDRRHTHNGGAQPNHLPASALPYPVLRTHMHTNMKSAVAEGKTTTTTGDAAKAHNTKTLLKDGAAHTIRKETHPSRGVGRQNASNTRKEALAHRLPRARYALRKRPGRIGRVTGHPNMSYFLTRGYV